LRLSFSLSRLVVVLVLVLVLVVERVEGHGFGPATVHGQDAGCRRRFRQVGQSLTSFLLRRFHMLFKPILLR
jgi:hypothetical protein